MISWACFSTWAALLQTFLPQRLIEITSWNYAVGWQREIGLWNIGAVLLLLLCLLSSQPTANIAIPVICTWSGLFGVNHLFAYVTTKAHGHLRAFILNIAADVWALMILLFIK
ncbi:MAG: hypothetical protein A2X86_06160 [Bdellovibrionales bacterium GWA2_49_15]|nr:MAG: hypothetical protein A2X86_06160 [Bdellovibrionales bacterium GWA2_49_15]HAZ14646.1 hypothetical protein [Bdellovibrionales bacterium]